MAFRIQNNIAAQNSIRFLNINSSGMNKSLERLSSGYRINSGADDAAGLASSMRFRAEISSLKVASRNAAEATSLLQVAEGAMSQVDLILNRMKELATQAASGNAGTDLAKLDQESTDLEAEITRIVGFTEYNGAKLIDGTFGAVGLSSSALSGTSFSAVNGVENIDVTNAAASTTFVISALSAAGNTLTLSDGTTSQQVTYSDSLAVNENEVLDFSALGIKITVNSQFATNEGDLGVDDGFRTGVLGQAKFQLGSENDSFSQLGFSLENLALSVLADGASADVDLSSTAGAQSALTTIDNAISYLAEQRGKVGALINRMTYASSNLAVSIENKTASESVIRDVDMAAEMSNFTKNQILVQASTAMLAQANAAPQNVLALLR